MAFFRQLRLLLWKNGLAVIRQPLWSVTLLAWPVLIFLIILVTRHQFPPVVKDTCYVSPRNLPSAGFFPFLQTLMCNTDSSCRNTSSLVDPTDSKSFEQFSGNTRSGFVQNSAPLLNLFQGGSFFNFSFQNESSVDHAQMASFLNNIFGSSLQESINNISLGNDNGTLLGDQETLNNVLESVNLVKRAMCTMTLPMINTTSSHPLSYALVTFCNSNSSVFEVSLRTFNQILTELMITKPNETVATAATSAFMFDQLQNHTLLWENLLDVPQLFSSSSDQVLNSTKSLLTNLQGALDVIQNSWPVANSTVSTVHPLLVGGINTIHYVQNWPGKGVSIPLGDIVTLQNDSLSVMVKAVLQEVQIPLDKAIGLTLDKNIVHSYMCDNSSNSLLLTAACSTGTLGMVLDWISPEMVAKQALLAWSQDVAPHDVSFIKGMLQTLIGGSSPGGQGGSNTARKRRSIDTQPQSIEEELFLSVGEVVMEVLQIAPEVDIIVQSILKTAFQYMNAATLALNTAAEIMTSGLKDADQLQLAYLQLMTNETQASIWIDHVLDSVMGIIIKTLESKPSTCEDLLSTFEWLLNTESIKIDMWTSMICQNNSTLQQALHADWEPLVQETQEMYSNFTGQADYNVTLPMILAEWQKLANSSLQFKTLSEKLITELDGEYWMNWMVDNSTFDVYGTLLQSYDLFVETFGQNIETIELWPEFKNYFYVAYWILNYRPGLTTQPANCSIDNTFAIQCNTGLNWQHITEVVKEALVSPNKALLNSLEGTVSLLQYMYGDVYKNLTASFLKQQITEDALSTYLGNLTHNLDGFFHNISNLPYSNFSNPDTLLPLLRNMLEPTGLSPLLTLFLGDSPLNDSSVLDIASKLGRIYQPLFTSNETDPIMMDLEQLILQFLSLEGNLTLPISHVMGYSLLNYSEYFSPDDLNHLTEAIQPWTNQTSPCLVEMILSAIKLWKSVIGSPNGDPANITVVYIRQLRELTMSLFKMQKIEYFLNPSGQLNITQANQISEDIINFLSHESLQNLTQAGPIAAQSTVIQKFVGFLPPEVQKEASPIIQELRSLENQFSECATGQNCSTQVSEIFKFLNQILDFMLTTNVNVTHKIPENITVMEGYENMTSMFFSILLSTNNDSNVKTLNRTLQFISMIISTTNISRSEIQNALEQSNLTLVELENIAVLAQAFNISNLLDNIMIFHESSNARQCFEPQQDSIVTAKCVMKLIDGISGFLRQLPNFQNETVLVHIPLVINKTISDMIQVNFSSGSNMVLVKSLYSTLANIKMNLQLNQLNTSEIMTELEFVEGLIQLYANMKPPPNSSLMMNPIYAEKVYLEILEWYLKKLENTTINSSFSDLLHPFFYLTQMQITLQLAQTDFSLYVSSQYSSLMNSLQYPIDGTDVTKIGETVLDVLQHLFDLINFDLEVQNTTLNSELFNTTILNVTELQIRQYLDLIKMWMIQPNVSLALTSVLHWGNSSMDVSTHVTDLDQLLNTLDSFLSDDQQAYLSVVNNITQSLRNALMLAELSGGLQSDDFSDNILEAVKYAIQIWTAGTEPLPVSTQENILKVVQESLKLIVQPGMSFASSRNISLLILKAAENVIQVTTLDMINEYIMYGFKVATTYIESTSTADFPDHWSQMILNEMKMVETFLPQNFTAQDYVSALINITYSILESNQGNLSLWSSFENATVGNMSQIFDQMGKALHNLWPLVMEGPGIFGMNAPSLESFAYLAPVLDQVMTGHADQDTWKNLEMMFESLLSTLEETELWGNVTSVIPHFEVIIETLVKIEQAENAMIESLQMPVLTLIGEFVQSANTTHLNLSDVSERMQLAVENMTNRSLDCGEVLKEWEPVREAAGLSHAAMSMWCNISLQPVLEAYAAAETVYSHLNMSHMGVGPVNASDAAARFVKTVQSLYIVSINQTLVTVQLTRGFSNHLSMLASQPLSPEAQLYWNQQLQDEQFLNSFSSIKLLSDELLNMAPFIRPYIKAMEKALHYTLHNYYVIQNSTTSNDPFGKAAMIFLTAVNTTLDNMLPIIWKNRTGHNESTITDIVREALKQLNDGLEFRDAPTVYQVLEQYLESNDKGVILQNVAQITAWLASLEANVSSDNIFPMVWGNWSGLNETSFTNMMMEAVKLLSEQQIFGDEPMIYQDLEKFLASNDKSVILQNVAEITAWLASMEANITSDNIFPMIWGNWSRLNKTSFTNMMREAVNLFNEQQIFGDEPMIYEDLENILESDDRRVILKNVAEIMAWLASMEANTTSDNIFPMVWGNWSGRHETPFTNMIREAVRLLSNQQLFGDEPMIYKGLEKFLVSNDKRVILQQIAEISEWLASMEANITSDNIFPMIWGNWSGLNETSFTNMMRKAVRLLYDEQILGNEPLIYEVLDQFVASNEKRMVLQKVAEITAMLASMEANITSDNIFPMIWGNWSGFNETFFTNMMREGVKHLSERKVFGDEPVIYHVIEKFLTSNDKRVILQKVAEVTAWLASIKANVSSDNIIPVIWGNWSGLNDTSFTNMMRKAVELLSDGHIFGNEPVIYQALEQILTSNDKRVILQNVANISTWLASMEANITSNNFSLIWGNWSALTETSFTKMMRKAVKLISDRNIFEDAWLASLQANITSDNIFSRIWGNWSELNETSFLYMMREAVKLLSDQHVFGNDPMINQALEQFLTSNDKKVILQKAAEITAWLASIETNITSDNIFSMIWGNWSGLNETTFNYMMMEVVKLLSNQQVFENEPIINQALEQFLTSNSTTVILQKISEITSWLAATEANFTSDDILYLIWGKWSGLNETTFTDMMREAVKLLSDQQIFGDEPRIYQDLDQFLTSSDKRVILQSVAEISTWFASMEPNITSDNIFSKIYFTNMMMESVRLLREQQLFGDEPKIYQALEQLLTSSNERVILQKVSEISTWLASIEANVTLDNILSMVWGNWSGINETSFANMIREAIKLLSEQQIFGDEPKTYQFLEQFLSSNNKTAILQKAAEITAWLASIEANVTSENIYSLFWGNWSGLNDTSFTNMMTEAVKLLSERQVFGDEPVVYQALEQFLASSDKSMILQTVSEISTWLASLEANITSNNIYSWIWGNWSGINETCFSNTMREVVKLLSDQHFFENEPMFYQTLEQFLTSNEKRVIIQKAAEITAWLASMEANITSENVYSMIWRHWSRLNETTFTNMMKEAVKLLIDQHLFGNDTMSYQALEQFLQLNNTNLDPQTLAEITAWLASIEANITSDNIYSMIWGRWSRLNETTFTNTMKEAVKLLSNQHLFGNNTMIYQALEQFLQLDDTSLDAQTLADIRTLLASIETNITADNIYSMIWGHWSRLNETTFTSMIKDAVKLLSNQHLFGNDTMIYQALEQYLQLDNTNLDPQTLAEIRTWLASIETNITTDNIYSMIWGHWSMLNETTFTNMVKEGVKLLSDQDLFGNDTMLYQALEQFLQLDNTSLDAQTLAEFKIWLASIKTNVSTDNIYSMIWGYGSRLNETTFTNLMKDVVKLLSDQHLFGNDTMLYQALEQLLQLENTNLDAQTLAEISTWLASIERNITADNIFSMIWGHWSSLNETSFTNMMKEAVKLLSNQDLFGNDTMLYQALEQFLQLDNTNLDAETLAEISTWLASIERNITADNIFSMIWGQWSSLNETSFTNMMKEAVKLLSNQDLFGNDTMIYQALEPFLQLENTSLDAQMLAEISMWLSFIEANITSDDIFSMIWGDLSMLTETHFTDMTREAVKLMSDLQIFGDEAMIYQDLEQFLASSNTSLIVKKMLDIIAWLPSTEANSSSDIFSMLMVEFSQLSETNLTNLIPEVFRLLNELQMFRDAPIVYQGLEQYLTLSNTNMIVQKMANISSWLASAEANITLDNVFSIMWGYFLGLNDTSSNILWEATKLMSDLQIFGDAPMVYQILGSNDTATVVQKLADISAWSSSTEASGLDLLTQSLTKIYEIFKPLFSLVKQTNVDMQEDIELFEELAGNIMTMLRLLGSSDSLPLPLFQHLEEFQQEILFSNYTMVQQQSMAPLMLTRDPMNDFIDLFYLNYPAMFEAISVPPTTEDIRETVHMFFNNPNLSIVLKGASVDIPWGLNASREETIDAALGVLSSITLPDTSQKPFMVTLTNAADMLPDDFPFSSLLKNFTRALANEYKENLNLTQVIIETATTLPQMNLTDPYFTEQLDYLRSKVCTLENTESVRLLMWSLSMEPGQLCDTFLPSLEILHESIIMNITSLSESIFQAVIGDPSTYNVQPTWTSVLSQRLGVNITSLSNSLNINISSPGTVTFGELLRNETAFVLDVQQRVNFDPAFLSLLMKATLPDKNMEILSWIVNLRHCDTTPYTSDIIFETFCSMSIEQWYTFSLLMARHINTEKVFYRVVLSEELQSLLEVMLGMAKALADMMDKMLPAIGQLQNFMISVQDLNLVANNEFKQMTRRRRSMSSQATFATLSQALCSNSIKALFDITKPTITTESTYFTVQQREDLIERFKIPRNATPFCKDLYLDMVSSTGGAIAWAFLKPMLMGQILYTPDTPVTRALMEKANGTLQEFADLKKNSEDWIKASDYIIDSSKVLSSTLPMLQNSLANSFVKSFIEMQTDINVDRMRETLNSFSNMTLMLEKNKYMLKQITTLSNLMVDLSSCVKFDRYRGFNSADELDTVAQDLAKNRDLYASVIFKLPTNQNSSTNRPSRSISTSSTSSLPPKVSYTIRMHMDNAMRTDRVRDPYFVKDTYILARRTMRYNRGFIYLQESIDRAIIEAQIGQKVTEPAVQLQPFPYPCFQRDEFLQAISYVFPIMLMIAWMLFVADFVRKLVHERELRLHEYMKMMGVNPLSHFFAWFLECAAHLLLTIFILTLILKYGKILPNSDGFILFLFLCDYGLSILAFSYLVSSFFDKTYIAGLSGSLLYILCFFPYIMVIALETDLTLSQKSALGLFAPTCFSYASQYVSRYEAQGEGIRWSNSYISPLSGDTASFGWLCWLMFIDSIIYFIIGAYIRMVFPGKYGIPAPWYFPFTASFWSNLFCCVKSERNVGKGLLITNIMQRSQSVFPDDKGKGQSTFSTQAVENYSHLPVGVSLHGLSKLYGNRAAIENLNVSFYEGHVTSLLGHNGAGKTTTMSLLTGLFPPSSGTIEVYGKDMQVNIEDVRKELGVCMQYDVLFDHLTTKEHLLLYGQIKAPHWSPGELHEQVRSILEETGMYAHRHKLVGTLSGGMKRKLSISIAFIGGSRLVVLDEPTTGVDPCSRRSIWDIVIQNKKHRTIIMSTHHLDEAEVLSDRIAFLERGGLKCCGSPFYLKDKLGQGYKLTLTKKTQMQNTDSERIDNAELKAFVQTHVPEARLKDTQGGDLVYSLPPFTSSNASSYRSLLTALDSNLDALQLGGYGISDTTLEEVFLQLTRENAESEGGAMSISETLSDTASIDSFSSDLSDSISNFGERIRLTGSSVVSGIALTWQQIIALLIKRFHHSRRDWKGLIAQILLPVLFMVFAMCLGLIKSDMQNYPDLTLSPALYNTGPSYSFFRNLNLNSSKLVDTMTSFPGIDNACLDNSDNSVCKRSTNYWTSSGNISKPFSICKCTRREQICDRDISQLPYKQIPSSQVVFNLSGFNVETYLIATANDFIRNRYGGFDFGMPLPSDLQMDLKAVPKNRTLSKVWYNPEGFHTMPAYLNSLSNIILRSNLPADKDPRQYAISVSSHPYFGRADDDDIIIQGMLQILVAVCVLTGYSITTTSFAIYEVKEHHSGSKRLQHIAGISETLYWTVNFFYDLVVYLIPVMLTVCVIAAFQIPAFTDRQNLAAIALLLVLFGFATFPWMYLLSEVFKDAEMAFITFVCINLFISVNTIMSTSILYFLSQLTTRNPEVIKDLFNKLSQAFLIFPQFNFGNGLMELCRMNIEVQILSGYGIDAYKNPFSLDGLGWMFISSFIQGLVFFTLRLLLNKSLMRKVRNLICPRKTVPQVPIENEDEDVATEDLRVSSGGASSDILQVNKLTKVYQHLKKKVYAVKKISVGIPAGECFGLLGVNGAGKTTTFKMLTGDVSPTDGTAQIKDWDGRLVEILECRDKGINIGYCPQVDALDSLLTGEEHLYFYARIRGISKKEIEGVVNYLLKRLELNYHKKIISDSYSCGTRRKLSTALALIGHPQILLLDEPSSGMDPRTKRHLWKIISEEVKGKCAVVLTSHSMEECEALCSRLAIMVKGQFRCLGSLQHIKNRFGSGFTVKMYLATASCDAAAITGFMQRQFPSTYLKDQHSNMLEYHIPNAPGGVADIFDHMESNKNALQIKHFSVSQTTLDEVFINFATGKIGMDTIPIQSEDDDLDSIKGVKK